jgi:hypothetical protein
MNRKVVNFHLPPTSQISVAVDKHAARHQTVPTKRTLNADESAFRRAGWVNFSCISVKRIRSLRQRIRELGDRNATAKRALTVYRFGALLR